MWNTTSENCLAYLLLYDCTHGAEVMMQTGILTGIVFIKSKYKKCAEKHGIGSAMADEYFAHVDNCILTVFAIISSSRA